MAKLRLGGLFLPVAIIITGLTAAAGCNSFFNPDEKDDHLGQIILGFEKDMYLQTKAVSDLPDTNDFILTVKSSSGSVLYDGRYGAAPLSILANPGTYTVTAVSCAFKAPAWSCPQYGDSQTVKVNSAQSTSILLLCKQLNSGVRLSISPDFLTEYPGGALFVSGPEGKLLYSYSEKRIAFFNPGDVSLVLSNEGKDETLLTRSLAAQEILSINVKVQKSTPSASAAIAIQIDTSRNWTYADYTIGSGENGGAGPGGGKENALNVTQAREKAGSSGVWLYGYIVGGDLTSSGASFKAPFSSKTNLLLAPKASVTDRSICLSVQLKSGEVRNALNLVDNPGNLGRLVYLKGDIVTAYYGLPGIQNISEFELN